jgi:hypothetical protein
MDGVDRHSRARTTRRLTPRPAQLGSAVMVRSFSARPTTKPKASPFAGQRRPASSGSAGCRAVSNAGAPAKVAWWPIQMRRRSRGNVVQIRCPNFAGFVWTEDAGVRQIGAISDGVASSPTQVSADGSTVTGESSGVGDLLAFRWTQTGIVQLGPLPGALACRHRTRGPDDSVPQQDVSGSYERHHQT